MSLYFTILHRFRDTINFAVYATACDLDKSFRFNKTLKLQTTYALLFMCKHNVIIVNTCYLPWGMGDRHVSNSKSNFQGHSRSFLVVPFGRPHVISYTTLALFRKDRKKLLAYHFGEITDNISETTQTVLRWKTNYGRPAYGRPMEYGRPLYFHPVVCSSFFFFPRLISAAAEWMSAILPHMVWP